MKKTLLLALALIFSVAVSAQVLIDEKFDSSEMPEGWSIMGDALTNWSISNTNMAGGDANEVKLGWYPQFAGTTRLVAAPVNLTEAKALKVGLDHYFDPYNNESKLGIATSSDGGDTWNVGWSYDYSERGKYSVEERIVTSDMGKDNVLICIFFEGSSARFQAWYFDNLVVTVQSNTEVRLNSIDIHERIGAGSLNVSFSVQNMGNDNIQSLAATYQIEGQDAVTETFTTSIASFETKKLTFNTTKNILPGEYKISISITEVNGIQDDPSDNSSSKNFNVSLSEKQRIPMIEHFSSSTCAPCVLINQLMSKLTTNNPGKYTYTKYVLNFPSPGDPYYTAECGVRHDYYQAYSAPRVHLDSELQVANQTAQPVTQTKLTQRYETPAFAEIRGAFNVNEEDNTINVIADVASYVNLKNVRVYISVNEKTTTENKAEYGGTGETEWHHVMMKMLPDAEGVITTLKAGESQRFEYSYDMDSTFMEELSDLEVAVWVQDYDTKEIFNSHYLYEYTNHPYPVENLQITEGNRLKITWDAHENAEPTGYNLYINNELTLSNTKEKSFSIDKQDFCIVEVVALYGNNTTSVGNVEIYSSEFDTPQNLSATDNTSNIVVTWDAVENATSYDVYRNKKFVANVETTSYTDGDFLKGDECCYQVRAVFGDNKSTYTKEVCVTASGDMIEELGDKFELYPNPVNDKLYIETEIEIEEVCIYTLTGVMVGQQTTDNGQQILSIDVTNLNSGIYFIKIITENGSIIKRIIKQ